MFFHYGGKFVSEEDLQDKGELRDDAIPFQEPGQAVFSLIANGGCIVLKAGMAEETRRNR